jgi:hypothetical protein
MYSCYAKYENRSNYLLPLHDIKYSLHSKGDELPNNFAGIRITSAQTQLMFRHTDLHALRPDNIAV